MGEIKQHAKAIKTDHALAMDLWASGACGPRLLATLILDRKQHEQDIANEHPLVQWAMNFYAGWIGVHQQELRERCVALGNSTRLYRDEKVTKNCTPNYLPEFIRIEVAERA